jgi:hypothetical protein
VRTIDIHLNDGDELIRLWATRGRRYWYALVESSDGTLRYVCENGGGTYQSGCKQCARKDAVGDIETRIWLARVTDDINYRPLETSAARIT